MKIKKLEGGKEKGFFYLEGIYQDLFSFEAKALDFPLLKDLKISSEIVGSYGENINFCGKGILEYEKLKIFPLTFSTYLERENFELNLENGKGIELKSEGFLDKDYNFLVKSNIDIKSLGLISDLNIDSPLLGEIILKGNLKEFEKSKGELNLNPFNLLYKENKFKFSEGIKGEIKKGKITFLESPIYHELAYMELSGSLIFFPNFSLNIKGSADFGDEIVNYFVPQLYYDGMASLNFTLEKNKDLKGEGILKISGYKLRYSPINFFLLNPKGIVKIKENKIILENLEGFTGDGKLSLNGEALLKEKINFERITLKGLGNNLRVSLFPGFVMFLNGSSEFIWSENLKQISGNLILLEGNYTKELNILGEISKILTPSKATLQTKELPQINLNLSIDVPSSLKVKNQLLNLACKGKIQILGTISNPIILGSLETLPKSKIYFNGVNYEIEKAKVIMSNPQEFDPLIELEATSNIRSYLIHLKLKGTLSHLTPQFSSEPYLPESDIISLLATGKVASQESGTWLSGASLLLSQQISEELSKQSSAIFGLDRIRIEPIFGETNITTARLTALKQISPNCTLSYTYNPITNQKDIISLECHISQDTYINLSQEEDGTYFFQIFQRKSL